MIHRSIRRAVRCALSLTALLCTLSLLLATGIAFAAAVGDQVELNATHPAGVPFHNAPGGSHTFQRVPTGTVAALIDTERGGRWLQLRLPDQRTGWILARYVGRTIAGSPPADTSAERTVWTSREGCQQVVGSGGRTVPANPDVPCLGLALVGGDHDLNGVLHGNVASGCTSTRNRVLTSGRLKRSG